MAGKEEQPIIIVKKKINAGGHHGGAWKVAYADFVTAMMAFFMVMWLSATLPQEQLGGMAEYFKNPSVLEGLSVSTVPGSMGPGGAGDAPVQVFDAVKPPDGDPGDGETEDPAEGGAAPMTDEEIEAQAKEIEKARLEDLKEQLEEAIDQSATLAAFKEQLLLDITPEGLRIQIVDQQNRPMFDSGSFRLQSYTINILNELAPYLQGVPNRLSITGHTDTTPFGGGDSGYTNWELSADRANAARRALVSGGVSMEKMARVVGVSDSVLFDKENPTNPINRRISIIVMNKATEDAALGRNEAPVDDAASGEAPTEDAPTEGAAGEAGDAAAAPEAAPAEAPAEASTDTPPAG
ncbi:flagellar motor protein MotB [Silanimonas sp.]|jgi:chemotaxis protein MotB|uniref:flagellar motor protein MotB n=1 Tax=Silanimonas sp. TaxID=1929290 RepID=UPI0037CB57FD